MADNELTPESPGCPRCRSAKTRVVADSPVEGAWRMFLCPVCFYSWRSTEPDYATTAAGIAPGFRIDSATLDQGKVMPTIPPLRDEAAGRS